jgi:hypothetical protein
MKNRALNVYFQPKIAERYERLEKIFPGIIELAISIKKIPENYAEKISKPNSKLNDLLTKQLREKSAHFENGIIKEYDLKFFMGKAHIRVERFRKQYDDREEISKMVSRSDYIDKKNKAIILRRLSI